MKSVKFNGNYSVLQCTQVGSHEISFWNCQDLTQSGIMNILIMSVSTRGH